MPRIRRSSRLTLEVKDETDWKIKTIIEHAFVLDYPILVRLREVLLQEMERGLSSDPLVRKDSSLQMSVTFVRDLLTGEECGDFLALDLGSTNFRVLRVELKPGGRCVSESEQFSIPERCLSGNTANLFTFIAESVASFLKKEGLDKRKEKLILGFTYSFPIEQTSLKSGRILGFNKNFTITDGVGEDPVFLLQEAINTCGLNVEVACVLNDATGTMMCGAFLDTNCCIGLIMGTGSNVCYMENIKNIPKWSEYFPSAADDCGFVLINVEWGAFGDNGCIDFLKSSFDDTLDNLSLHKGLNTFEKLFSGLYLGEVVRVTLLSLCEQGLVFGGKPSPALLTPGGVPSSFVSRVEQDSPKDLSNTHRCLRQLKLEVVADDDYHVVRYLAHVLSVRSAQIICTCLSAIVSRMNRAEVAVAVDGSLYANHTVLQDLMQEYIERYCKETLVRFVPVSDGSGKGAAFTAAMTVGLNKDS